MRFSLIAAILPALFVCNAATAQVSGMASPTPTMGATSPLGIGTGSAVSQTGIPLGSTEIASPGVSPAPTVTGTIAMPSSGTTCSTLGTSPSSMFGSTASFDGGGMAAGSAAPATAATSGMSTSSGMSATSGMSTTSGMLETSGMSGMCGSGSSSIASSSTPTSTSPQRRVVALEPEFRWDPPRLAILELVPQQRYRRTTYCPRWVRWEVQHR